MTNLSAAEIAFLTARSATDRGALERYRKEHGPASTDTFRRLPLLHAPELLELVLVTAGDARGQVVDGDTLFPINIWNGGAEHTRGGLQFDRSILTFTRLLTERALAIAPKRSGWVVEPTTNTDGHRTNESTTAMHALFLDCDASGEWHLLLETLTRLGYAFVAYQSGGYAPGTPKWRVVFPLSRPFTTNDEAKRLSWKNLYHHARVTFGALGGLLGEGFDPRTDTPCCPWFLTEKRDLNDPPRQIIWRPGCSLDLTALALALPAVEEEAPKTYVQRSGDSTGLSDEKINEIIITLSKVTAHVPSGRHDLYLALPGVMLDRGVPADEVLAIIEAVSANYPRVHQDKHKDNLHNAKTTIGKWEDGGTVTRIGTLNERWPEIAQALDNVLPDPVSTALLASTTAMLSNQPAPLTLGTPPPNPSEKKRRRRLSPLGKEVAQTARHMKRSPKANRRFGALLIDKILDGESFETTGSTPEHVDSLVNAAMLALGFNLPLTTTWQEVLDLAHVTLLSMDFTQSAERVEAAQKAFFKGQRQKRKWINKKQAETDSKLEQSRTFFNAADAKAKNR